ncbi:MAG: 30S ribosomal protein S13 [Thermoplasmata archaeon]|jgi:small subunit ribosomal protein S13|nr:30S ribosomal protein S13 [Thermoplasmata archaeon]MVT13863.1 30S ribosomal protein S13 [Euryarchaeota archaeon]MVT14090.1 30S ribosomal protein S13 [Euryarchaeota archaeon]MVT35749.1 30S ribosomal protein S13 [Euryarchaeota archaeon]
MAEDKEFKYIVRLANTDLDGNRIAVYGLMGIKGLGYRASELILKAAGIPKTKKIGELSDDEVDRLKKILDNPGEHLPWWAVNRKRDLLTGKNIHLLSSDLELAIKDDIDLLKKIRAYRGIRHERGLPVRGQRTKSNDRKGLTVGVSKKKEVKT